MMRESRPSMMQFVDVSCMTDISYIGYTRETLGMYKGHGSVVRTTSQALTHETWRI